MGCCSYRLDWTLNIFFYISNLDIVTQLFEHLYEHLIHDTVLLVYKPTDVRSGSTDHLRKLRLGDAFFQAFDLYVYIKIILYHNAPRFQ